MNERAAEFIRVRAPLSYQDGRRDTILLQNLRARLSDTTRVSVRAVD